MLILETLPWPFYERFGIVPERLLVRKCYEELYSIVKNRMNEGEALNAPMLFTGVPGIGKSMFMLYFLCKLLEDSDFADKAFAVEFDRGKYHFFSSYDNETSRVSFITNATSEDFLICDVLVLSDICSQNEPLAHAKFNMIFSSPNPARYKEFMKAARNITFCLPTWSEEELLCYQPDVNMWYERFVHVGGVARLVLWDGIGDDPMKMFYSALNNKGARIANYFFQSGFGDIDILKSYLLIHINPQYPNDLNNTWNYMDYSYSFASDFVFNQIKDIYNKGLVSEAVNLFETGATVAKSMLGAVSAGHLFEKICLWLVPLAESTMTPSSCVSLKEGQAPLGDIKFPMQCLLQCQWKLRDNLLLNVLYQPQVSNLEAGDAFCLIKQADGTFMLIVLQITIAERHPVKANGLKVIVNAYSEQMKANITRKVILFVIPVDGELRIYQPLYTQNNRVVEVEDTNLHPGAKKIEQWAYHRVVSGM